MYKCTMCTRIQWVLVKALPPDYEYDTTKVNVQVTTKLFLLYIDCKIMETIHLLFIVILFYMQVAVIAC